MISGIKGLLGASQQPKTDSKEKSKSISKYLTKYNVSPERGKRIAKRIIKHKAKPCVKNSLFSRLETVEHKKWKRQEKRQVVNEAVRDRWLGPKDHSRDPLASGTRPSEDVKTLPVAPLKSRCEAAPDTGEQVCYKKKKLQPLKPFKTFKKCIATQTVKGKEGASELEKDKVVEKNDVGDVVISERKKRHNPLKKLTKKLFDKSDAEKQAEGSGGGDTSSLVKSSSSKENQYYDSALHPSTDSANDELVAEHSVATLSAENQENRQKLDLSSEALAKTSEQDSLPAEADSYDEKGFNPLLQTHNSVKRRLESIVIGSSNGNVEQALRVEESVSSGNGYNAKLHPLKNRGTANATADLMSQQDNQLVSDEKGTGSSFSDVEKSGISEQQESEAVEKLVAISPELKAESEAISQPESKSKAKRVWAFIVRLWHWIAR